MEAIQVCQVHDMPVPWVSFQIITVYRNTCMLLVFIGNKTLRNGHHRLDEKRGEIRKNSIGLIMLIILSVPRCPLIISSIMKYNHDSNVTFGHILVS